MRFQVKEYDKESFYKVHKWVFDKMHQSVDNKLTDIPDIHLIDWNQWDYKKQGIKPMYVEITDPTLALLFKLTMGQYLE